MTVDVGDTVTWSIGSGEPHTVSFGPPPGTPGSEQNLAPAGGTVYDGTGWVSSGLVFQGKTYSLTFTKPGTYQYACAIHPSMHGTVVVQPSGSPYPSGQSTYQPSSDASVAATIKAGEAAIAAEKVSSTSNGNGTTTYTVAAGFGDGKTFSVQRFGANNITIRAGDSVTWVQKDSNQIHTISFLQNGQDVPFTLPNGQPNLQAVAPAGGNVYSGQGYFNSGILTGAPAPGPHSYTLRFTKPGNYQYVCLVHDDLGMKGTITVVAAAPPGLPKTGGPGASASAVVGLLLIGGGLIVGRRRGSR